MRPLDNPAADVIGGILFLFNPFLLAAPDVGDEAP
jgi:hypothetical protein